jgi:hypothetical protein
MADTRKRGHRPPLDPESPSVSVSVRVPRHEYEDLRAEADRTGLKVAQVLRRRFLHGMSREPRQGEE